MAEAVEAPADPQSEPRESPRDGSPSQPPPPPRRDGDSRDRKGDWPPSRREDHHDSRSSSPPPPPPPALGRPRGEKDREYRRRSSPSPPPYRDRRRSPPRRSPPPGSFKRARRDDGGYDRRRGSPRGGYVPDDRRYGYDYGGGYDRVGSGSRGGYGDERPYGRHMYRSSDLPDSGHGGYGDGPEFIQSGPGSTASSASKSGNGSEPNSEDEAGPSGKRRRHDRGPAKENELLSATPKAHPVSSEPRRIQSDVEQAQALVRKLDIEKGIQDNVLSSSGHDKLDAEKSHGGSMGPIVIIRGLATVKGLEGVELLDTLITYLWRVHGLDYYGMSEASEAKGLRHVRADNKTHDGTNASASDWEKKLDSFWLARLQGQDPLETLTAKDKIDAAATEALDPFVRKIRDEKYGWNDPSAPGGTPVMQQSAPSCKFNACLLLSRFFEVCKTRIDH
ncbi:hypothetical protein C4D60_Mb05t24650 [Musa balbisiana]|uniref:SERRATE/Ars2 N-terminal domain-containing protein n=1 Tax=Musa balbisiana TaxID=52838 RepID=A0A4S8JYK1_MUSBA|nr:hypothetical protein C4D60_Mb05t24650 [Musa balbisiana]